MLSIKNMSVDYGASPVVSDFSLELAEDEILMLLGPTGCGKTTILQAIAGLIPIAEGEVALGSWSATPSKEIPPERRNVGMVFQDFALFPHLTVEENACFRLNDPAPALHWLELLGLMTLRNAKPERLSGGQKQRVALARTLAHDPSLILLDEPLSNLDAALKNNLRWEIREALKAARVPAIWVTHDQHEALSVGDRIAILKEGSLEQVGEPTLCFEEPANRFVARFLGMASFLPGRVTLGKASTALGELQVAPGAAGEVEVLVRPEDCTVVEVEQGGHGGHGGHGELCKAQYEGSTWLYSVYLDDGTLLSVRAMYNSCITPGSRVSIHINRPTALASFPLKPE